MSGDSTDPAVAAGGDLDLRPGSDDCYKCSACDVECPVAEVDDEFPGPKFQGPEQWRLTRSDERDIDPSITHCSNCMRCDTACPSGVSLTQMHNVARAEYVDQQGWSVERVRNKILGNYGRIARVLSRFPRLTNAVMGLSVTRWLNERVLGLTAEREFPEFATETFREWWEQRGGYATSKRRAREARAERDDAAAGRDDRRVAYFHGDYANYNTPEVGKALVRVYEAFGYEVVVPDQRCSGTPMLANGLLDDARRAAGFNVETLDALVEEGVDVVASCTSCSMAIRTEYPEVFDFEGAERVAAHTYDALEYLRVNEDLEAALAGADVDLPDLAYHAPCHARNQGLAGQPVEVLDGVGGLGVTDVGDSCSGISGTYGWKEEHYETSMAVGEEMFEGMAAADAETGMTECPTCAMQMEHGTGYEVLHPLAVLEEALLD